jgi:predicted Zn-dependent protease
MPDPAQESEGQVASIVTAAIGFCELGMWQDAWDELDTLPPEQRARPDALRIRLEIFTALERWDLAAILAEGMIERGETSRTTWLQGGKAIRASRGPEAAKAFLLRGTEHLRRDGGFHYAMAQIDYQLGDMDATKFRLSLAFSLDPKLKAVAMGDADLYPIW